MSDFIQQFGFGQGDRAIGQQTKRFKGEGGKRYRVSFAWWEGIEDGTPNFDADHFDHFHMEIKGSVRWFLYH